jgi:hypothetical protein
MEMNGDKMPIDLIGYGYDQASLNMNSSNVNSQSTSNKMNNNPLTSQKLSPMIAKTRGATKTNKSFCTIPLAERLN